MPMMGVGVFQLLSHQRPLSEGASMTKEELAQIVKNFKHDTQIARAFRKALGINDKPQVRKRA